MLIKGSVIHCLNEIYSKYGVQLTTSDIPWTISCVLPQDN